MEGLNKLTISDIQKHKIYAYETLKSVDWYEHRLKIRTLLNPQEVISFIECVLSICFGKEENDYPKPDLLDYAIKVNVIVRYGLVNISDDLNEQYELVYGTNLYDTIKKNISQSQIQYIEDCIYEIVKFNQ